MSVGAIVAIAVGGTVLLGAGITWMVVRLNRSYKASSEAALGRLQEEVARRGWTFAERDDSVAELYNQLRQQFSGPNLIHPLVQPPQARAARNVITGTHRGRPFVAAVFDTYYKGENTSERCIWVRTPATRPSLTVRKVAAAQNTVNEAIGREGVRSGNPEFDRSFDVLSEDRQWAAQVLSPALIDLILTNQQKFRGFMLFADHIDVLDPVSDHRDPAELIPALDLRCDILDRIHGS